MAYNRFHQSLTAGVALVGAGAIAFAPLPTPLTDEVVAAPPAYVATPRVVNTEVDPVVFATALQILATGAVGSVEDSLGTFTDQIPAMWNQVVTTWADTNELALNYSLVASIFVAPVAPLVVGPFTDAVAEVVAQAFPGDAAAIRENLPAAVDYLFARMVGPWVSAFSAISVAHLGSYEAGMSGDPNARIIALLKAPLDVIDGFLFGGYGDLSPLLTGELGGDVIAAPGLLTPLGQWPSDRNPTTETGDEAGTAAVPEATAEQAELPAGDDTLALTETDETSDVTEVVEAVATEEVTAAVDEIESAETEETDETVEELVAAEEDELVAADETEASDEKDEKEASSDTEAKDTDAKDADAKDADDDAAKADDAEKADKTEKAEKPAADSGDTE
ncbi:hypothetical protein BH10ACT9_BH10ACT9_38540 [soil metagenome]